MQKWEKEWHIYYLLHLHNNPTKFQFNWIRTQNFQLKLFNIALTLKCVEGPESGKNKVSSMCILSMGLLLTHRCASLLHYSSKWHSIATVNTLTWCTIKGVYSFFTTIQEHIPLKVKYRTMHKFTPVGPRTVWPRAL